MLSLELFQIEVKEAQNQEKSQKFMGRGGSMGRGSKSLKMFITL